MIYLIIILLIIGYFIWKRVDLIKKRKESDFKLKYTRDIEYIIRVIKSCVNYLGVQRIITSPLEHKCVAETCLEMKRLNGVELVYLRPDNKANLSLEKLEELDILKQRHLGVVRQLEFNLGQESKKLEKEAEINKIFEDYHNWIKDTMEIEREPFIQIIATLRGNK